MCDSFTAHGPLLAWLWRSHLMQVRSWLSALPGGRSSVTTIDSNASQSMRLPTTGILGSGPVSPPPKSELPPAMPAAAAGSPPGTGPPSSAAAQLRPPGSGFLVQQPSSKLWMEAVPMRSAPRYNLRLQIDNESSPCKKLTYRDYAHVADILHM